MNATRELARQSEAKRKQTPQSEANVCRRRSALVNIRRKALLSSVGFRKRITSRSPRGSSCDSCKLRFDRPL